MRYLVAFRSRSGAVRFYDEMTRRGEGASLTANRRQCGLAVKVSCLNTAKHILALERYSSFCSIYEIVDGREIKVY